MKQKPDVNAFLQGGAAEEQRLPDSQNSNSIVDVALDDIIPQAGQDRDDWDSPDVVAHIHGLAESMKIELPDGRKYGIRKPLEVLPPDADGKHIIISGESRWRAAKLAVVETAPCIIRQQGTVENRLDHVTENALKKGLTLWQQANSIRRDKEEFSFSSKQIMVAHGIRNKTQLSKITAVFSLPEQAQQLVKRDLVGDVNLIYDLKKLDEKQLSKLEKKIEKGVSVPQAIKSLLPKPAKKAAEPKEKISESETGGESNTQAPALHINLALTESKARALALLLDISSDSPPENLGALIDERLDTLAGEDHD